MFCGCIVCCPSLIVRYVRYKRSCNCQLRVVEGVLCNGDYKAEHRVFEPGTLDGVHVRAARRIPQLFAAALLHHAPRVQALDEAERVDGD